MANAYQIALQALQALKQRAGNVISQASSFVQQNPTPIGYARQQITPIAQKFIQNLQQSWNAPPQAFKPSPAVSKFISWTQEGTQRVQQSFQQPLNYTPIPAAMNLLRGISGQSKAISAQFPDAKKYEAGHWIPITEQDKTFIPQNIYQKIGAGGYSLARDLTAQKQMGILDTLGTGTKLAYRTAKLTPWLGPKIMNFESTVQKFAGKIVQKYGADGEAFLANRQLVADVTSGRGKPEQIRQFQLLNGLGGEAARSPQGISVQVPKTGKMWDILRDLFPNEVKAESVKVPLRLQGEVTQAEHDVRFVTPKRFVAKEVEVEGLKRLRIFDTKENSFIGRFYRNNETALLEKDLGGLKWATSMERVSPTQVTKGVEKINFNIRGSDSNYWGQQIAKTIDDPSNITKEDWKVLDPIYKKLNSESPNYSSQYWDNAIQIAKARAKETGKIIMGPGEGRVRLPEYYPELTQTTGVPRVAERIALRNVPSPTNQASRLSPSHGLGKDLSREGLTWDQIIRLTPSEGQKILQGRAMFDDLMRQTPVKQKVNLIDYLRTPNRVLEKIGMGDESKLLRQQYDTYQTALPKEIDKITAWSKRVSPEANEKIFRWLDGEKTIVLTPAEQGVAGEIRTYLNDWATKLNLPPHRRVSEYITRLFRLGTIEAEFDEDLARIIDPKIAKSIYNPFLEKRIGTRIDYLRDTWGALQAYVKRGTRKYYMDPVLERVAIKAEALPLESWNYVKAKISGINMRPEDIDNLIDNAVKSSPIGYRLGQRPTALVTRKARQMVFRGLLGLNPASALRNLSQSTNTYALTGEKNFFIGLMKTVQNLPRLVLGKDTELEAAGVLGKNIIQDRNLNAVRKFWQTADEVMYYQFDLAEKINRGIAYWAGKAQGTSRGMNEQQAIEFAKDIVGKTQFYYDVIDTPVALQSDLAKTLFQFAKYPVAQTEFLLEMVGRKDVLGSLRWIGSSLLFIATAGKILGMDWKDMFPQYRFGNPPTLQLPWEAGKAALNVPDQYGKVSDEQNPLMRIIQSQGVQRGALNYFPAGSQIKRTIQGLQSYNKGESTTPTGNIRFPVEQTTSNLIRSGLFGQYSTPQAKQYFDTNARPLSEKQSELVRSSTDRMATYQEILQKRVEDAQISHLKDVVKQTGTPSYLGSTYVFIDQRTGDTKSIDTNFQPTIPTYTGNYELDKIIKSQYFSEITKRKNIIVDLYEQKQLTASEAEKQLQELATLKASTSGGTVSKGRKIAFRSIKAPKISAAKAPAVRRLKFKIPVIKPLKIGKLKVRGLARVPKMRRLKLRSVESLQRQFLNTGRKNALQIALSSQFRRA